MFGGKNVKWIFFSYHLDAPKDNDERYKEDQLEALKKQLFELRARFKQKPLQDEWKGSGGIFLFTRSPPSAKKPTFRGS